MRPLQVVLAFALLVPGCGQGPPSSDRPPVPVVHQAQLLTLDADDWEPDLAAGAAGAVYVTAGRRAPVPEEQRNKDGALPFEQRIVIWRSADGGTTWEGPEAIAPDTSFQGDERVVVDGNGIVHVSYMGIGTREDGTMKGLLWVATSSDGGRSFETRLAMDEDVSDKPELAVSADGQDIYIVLESRPGPQVVASHDGGTSWGEPSVVVPVEDRATHFWPTGFELAPDGRLWMSAPSIPNDELQQGGPSTATLHWLTSDDRGATWHDTVLSSSPWTRGECVHDPDCRVKTAYPGVAVDAVGRAYAVYTAGTTGEPYRLLLQSSVDGGVTWSEPTVVSQAARPATSDLADHEFPMAAASGDGRVCVAWIDDRSGPFNLWARCSSDGGTTWGDELLMSSRADERGHTTSDGFPYFYGDYGGVALTDDGRLHVTWGAATTLRGATGPGSVWVNSAEVFPPLPGPRR